MILITGWRAAKEVKDKFKNIASGAVGVYTDRITKRITELVNAKTTQEELLVNTTDPEKQREIKKEIDIISKQIEALTKRKVK